MHWHANLRTANESQGSFQNTIKNEKTWEVTLLLSSGYLQLEQIFSLIGYLFGTKFKEMCNILISKFLWTCVLSSQAVKKYFFNKM